jgi:hypothetical protein
VKVRHDEGIANHIGPEPCVAARKDVNEASVGEGIGQPLSHEIRNSGCRRCFEGGRQHGQGRYRKAWRLGGVEELACVEAPWLVRIGKEPQGNGRRNGSPRSSTISAPHYSGSRFSPSSEKLHRAWMG